MAHSKEIMKNLTEKGLLPLYFHRDKDIATEILRALYRAGVRVVEFTNRGEEALGNFSHLRKIRDKEMPDLFLAAGTVKTRQHALAFIVEGADFIISPGFNEEVGKTADDKNTLWIPGCMTPSEIMKAEELGASVIKLFPGNLLGPGFHKRAVSRSLFYSYRGRENRRGKPGRMVQERSGGSWSRQYLDQ